MEIEIKSILVIDDNADYRKALLVRLESLFPDARIEEYDFVIHGLPAADFNWEKHDVLILDYYLGGSETGLQWFKKYKKTEYFPATVILTGMDDKATAKRVLKSGVHHYLCKTKLTKGELFDGLKKALAVRARKRLLSSIS
ncbi:MAG: hypothetical protein HW386_1537 [Gammaproteobacteria bacterium]|nr:hypothetical protein [Gammaproteobacteria bacterium]